MDLFNNIILYIIYIKMTFSFNDPIEMTNTLNVSGISTLNILDVTSSIRINGTEIIDSAGLLNSSSLPTSSSFENLTITGTAELHKLEVLDTSPEIKIIDERTSFPTVNPTDIGKVGFWSNDVSISGGGYVGMIKCVNSNGTVFPDGTLEFQTGTNGTLTTRMVVADDGNVGIATSDPSKNLEVNGTFLVSGNDGFSGMVCSFVGELSTVSDNTKFSYGDGSNSSRGITMVKSGTVIGMSCSTSNTSYMEVELYKNNGVTSQTITQGTFVAPPGDGYTGALSAYATKNYAFAAGDTLMLRTVTTNLTPANANATFWVRYD